MVILPGMIEVGRDMHNGDVTVMPSSTMKKVILGRV